MKSESDFRYGEFRATTGDYVMAPNKAKIVDLAIRMGRPLLVEGEAGCGKTKLAYAIANELGLPRPDVPEPVRISVKSTSHAKDLLYRFDALGRLQDSQLKGQRERDRAKHIYNYIHLEKLGAAIHAGEPAVVLIDELDKADIDFPNDLLDVLDDFWFDIEEIPIEASGEALRERGFGRHVASQGGVRPIVVITSNRDKQLPEPFLRRCLYLELKFPEREDDLAKIVEINLKRRMVDISSELVREAVAVFLDVRRTAKSRALRKLPATGELIDWVHALHWREDDGPIRGPLPAHWELLFKTAQDLDDYQRSASVDEATGDS